jgi:hypothetical protein
MNTNSLFATISPPPPKTGNDDQTIERRKGLKLNESARLQHETRSI